MTKALILWAVALFAIAACIPTNIAASKHYHGHFCGDDLFRGEDVEVNFNDGCITFTDEETGETVQITEERHLLVNDCVVHLDGDQRMLVGTYYDSFSDLAEEAVGLAKDAAKVGVAGAKLGVCAVLGTLKLISPDYDSNDLEADLEIKGSKIERMANRIEKRGSKLERRAESLKCLHEELRREIHELGELEWF